MGPPVMRPIFLQRREDVKILQLGESKESGSGDDIDTEDLGQAVMVQIERVLEGEKVIAIRMHNSSVLDHVNVFWRPSCCDVGYDRLLKERPIAGEANEEWSGFVDVRGGRVVP